MNPTGITIGAYYLASYASTPAHVRDLAACGIDLIVKLRYDRSTLDLLAQNGVGAIVTGIVPDWFGGDGSNAGTMQGKNPLDEYRRAAQGFEDHPAIRGIDVGDEPSALDFPHCGRVIETVSQAFPGKVPYLNLYPSFGLLGSNTPQMAARQLGTDSYEAYIERYVQSVPTPYICFDYYLYSADLPGMLASMMTVSRACIRHKRDMWTVLQVNSHQPDVFISEAQLRFQANCALAFGARTIIWACYCAGWWYNHVLDRQGSKTQQYDKLKQVNAQLHRLGEACRPYRHTATHFVGGFTADELARTGQGAVSALKSCCFRELHANGTKLLVGQMRPTADSDGEALFIAAAEDGTCTIHFECSRPVSAIAGEGEVSIAARGEGGYTLVLNPCQGVLLIAS